MIFIKFHSPNFTDSVQECSQYSPAIPRGFGEAVLWTFYATMMHLLGIIGGYLMKKSLIVSRHQVFNGEQSDLKITDLSECAALGFCLNIFLFIMILFSNGQLSSFRHTWHWAFVPAITAAFMGYYISRSCESPVRRFYISLLQGLVTAGTALVVFLSIHDIQFLAEQEKCMPLNIYLYYCVITALILGFALGVILQSGICSTNSKIHSPP